MNDLVEAIEDIKDKLQNTNFDETNLRQKVILRILHLLGWDIYGDEVESEYVIPGGKGILKGRVDYCLKLPNDRKIFVEVKKPSVDLNEDEEDQLLRYSLSKGAKMALLTNGILWWFFLPYEEAEWRDCRAFTINFIEQKSQMIAENLVKLLNRENVFSGEAIVFAESAFESKKRNRVVASTLPKAWKKIIRTPDEILVDLLKETTEGICGYSPSTDECRDFILELEEVAPHEAEHQRRTSKKAYTTNGTAARQKPLIRKSYAENSSHLPKLLYHLFEVIKRCKNSYQYNDACTEVALDSRVAVQTIYDGCTRRLGIKTDQFKHLLDNREQLKDLLLRHFHPYFKNEISDFFEKHGL